MSDMTTEQSPSKRTKAIVSLEAIVPEDRSIIRFITPETRRHLQLSMRMTETSLSKYQKLSAEFGQTDNHSLETVKTVFRVAGLPCSAVRDIAHARCNRAFHENMFPLLDMMRIH